MLMILFKKDEDSTSSIWGDAPDKYGRWNCRCFVRTGFFTAADHLMTRDPEVGPRFWFLADSIRQLI